MYAINQIKKLNDDEVNDVIDYISYLEWKKCFWQVKNTANGKK
jgi:hypothetical protein